jgi:hypothetical protein
MKLDFWICKDDEYSKEVFSRRKKVQLSKDIEACITSPEDIILLKLLWHKAMPSPRHLEDAAGVYAVQKEKLDMAYLNKWASRHNLVEELKTIMIGKILKDS